jgi:hypothetical protein
MLFSKDWQVASENPDGDILAVPDGRIMDAARTTKSLWAVLDFVVIRKAASQACRDPESDV